MTNKEINRIFNEAEENKIRVMQDEDELGLVAQCVLYMDPPPETVVELGVAFGGWIYVIHKICPSIKKFIGVDVDISRVSPNLPEELKNKLSFIVGDCKSKKIVEETGEKLDRANIDVLHIDAEHSYDSAWTNFENYSPMVRSGGLVIFHDIRVKSRKGCAMFFREVMSSYFHIFVHQRDEPKQGIGILRL